MVFYLDMIRFLILSILAATSGFGFSEATRVQHTGVVIVAHGLNNSLAAMQPIISSLQERNFIVVPLLLDGHLAERANPETDMPQVSREAWTGNFIATYNQARLQAKALGLPLHLVGYSLGGLLAVHSIESIPNVTFNKMVLLAPAIRSPGMTRLVLASPFESVPSAAPERVRSHKSTAKSAYRALFSLQDTLATGSQLAQIPTTVVFDQADELVDMRASRRWLESVGVQWNYLRVRVQSGPHHLIIDPIGMGTEEWSNLTTAMLEFLAAR